MDIEYRARRAAEEDLPQLRILYRINHYFGSASKFAA
jgi:hypothetical protein